MQRYITEDIWTYRVIGGYVDMQGCVTEDI